MTTFEIFLYVFASIGFIVFIGMICYFLKYFIHACRCLKEKYGYMLGAYEEE